MENATKVYKVLRPLIDELYALIAGVAARPVTGGTQYTFIFRPGAAPIGNIYATWAALYTAMSLVPGPKLVEVDTAGGVNPAHVTGPGPYDLNEVAFVPTSPLADILNIDTGTVILPGTLHFLDGLRVVYAGVAPCMTAVAGGTIPLIDVNTSARLSCSAGGPFLSVPNGATGFVLLNGAAQLGDTVHSVVDSPAGGNGRVVAADVADISQGSLTGAGCSLSYDSTCTVGALPGVTVRMASEANQTRFRIPVGPPDPWPAPPTDANDAVNTLALIMANHAIADSPGAALLPALPTYEPVASIIDFVPSAKGSGKLRVVIAGTLDNTDVAKHTVTPGVAIVPHGNPPPSTSDYSPWGYELGAPGGPAVPSADGFTLLCDYVGTLGFPAALVPGNHYDIYAMAAADAGGFVAVPGHAVQMTVQELL